MIIHWGAVRETLGPTIKKQIISNRYNYYDVGSRKNLDALAK